jgi:uncharacterized protein
MAVSAIWLVGGCAWGGPPAASTPPSGLALEIGDVTVDAEIADDSAERSHGLMERTSLPLDHGMLFVYPDERPRTFWMKNTPLPLSIAFMDAQGRIVRIADMEPYDLQPVPSGRPAMYALEMTKGWFALHAVQVGVAVRGLPPAAKE